MAEPPYGFIADGLREGGVVPFFGAAASAIYRPNGETWTSGKPFMPFGGELATALGRAAGYPAEAPYHSALADAVAAIKAVAPDIADDRLKEALLPVLRRHMAAPSLALIASWSEHVAGDRKAVDKRLRAAFMVHAQPGLLHTKLAEINATKLYITTNYDDLLEKALAPRTPHVIIDRGKMGLWVGVAGGKLQRVSPTGDELYGLLNDPETQEPTHPIIFKMHGSIDRGEPANENYLITEEDYVDFLGKAGGEYITPYLTGLMRGKSFLFLGYSLEDWNVRVILRKLMRPPSAAVKCWAIVRGRSESQQDVAQAHALNIYPMDLAMFAQELGNNL